MASPLAEKHKNLALCVHKPQFFALSEVNAIGGVPHDGLPHCGRVHRILPPISTNLDLVDPLRAAV